MFIWSLHEDMTKLRTSIVHVLLNEHIGSYYRLALSFPDEMVNTVTSMIGQDVHVVLNLTMVDRKHYHLGGL